MVNRIFLKYDFRRAPFSPVSHTDLYHCALEQVQWGEKQGIGTTMVCEHHGTDDGYCPSPLITLSAMAAVTEKMRLVTSVIILPFHNPLRLAEDIAVLDVISNGRVDLVMAAGYIPSEFEMFDVPLKKRPSIVENSIATLRRAWTGEFFDYHGRQVKITPVPVQVGGPKIILGGSSDAAAKRAAKIADGYMPAVPETFMTYIEESHRLNKTALILGGQGPLFLYVSEDPDQAWAEIAPYAMHETNCYSQWAEQAGMDNMYYRAANDADALRKTGMYAILTPEQCIKMAQDLGDWGAIALHPLMGGLPPELSWPSLELFASKVLPELSIDSGSVFDMSRL